jgi:hypothetical protein
MTEQDKLREQIAHKILDWNDFKYMSVGTCAEDICNSIIQPLIEQAKLEAYELAYSDITKLGVIGIKASERLIEQEKEKVARELIAVLFDFCNLSVPNFRDKYTEIKYNLDETTVESTIKYFESKYLKDK